MGMLGGFLVGSLVLPGLPWGSLKVKTRCRLWVARGKSWVYPTGILVVSLGVDRG